MQASDERGRQLPILRAVLLAVSAFLLLSMGGAIIAAPLTLPLLYATARSSKASGAYRALAAVVAFLTAGELAWALTYILVSEAKPWIWLLPLLAAVGTAWLFVRLFHEHDGQLA